MAAISLSQHLATSPIWSVASRVSLASAKKKAEKGRVHCGKMNSSRCRWGKLPKTQPNRVAWSLQPCSPILRRRAGTEESGRPVGITAPLLGDDSLGHSSGSEIQTCGVIAGLACVLASIIEILQLRRRGLHHLTYCKSTFSKSAITASTSRCICSCCPHKFDLKIWRTLRLTVTVLSHNLWSWQGYHLM